MAWSPPAPRLQIRAIDDEGGFASLHAQWSDLLARCPDANVFLSHEWLYAWWSAYRPAAQLRILVAESAGRTLGIAPMMLQRERRGGITVVVLRFIGDGTWETDHMNLVVDGAHAIETTAALLDAIDRLRWDVAEFNQMPEASTRTAALLEWTAGRGLHPVTTVVPCPVRRLPASFDELLAGLPSRLRTTVRSARRKLLQQQRAEFGLHRQPGEVDEALAAFFANHASRWQGKGQTGVFTDPRKRDFYLRLTPRLLERGWLRFYFLKLDGRIVAQQYCFALDSTVMLLQEGFDFRLAPDNLGHCLRACVFEHLIATGARCYDFLAGTSRNKLSWSDGVVNDLRIRCARRSWRGWVAHVVPNYTAPLRARVNALFVRKSARMVEHQDADA